MKACPMKGKEDVRLSYRYGKKHLPKACFCKNYHRVMEQHLDKDTLALSFVKVLKTKYACEQIKETTSFRNQQQWGVCTNSLYAPGRGSAPPSTLPAVKAPGNLTDDNFIELTDELQALLDEMAEAEKNQLVSKPVEVVREDGAVDGEETIVDEEPQVVDAEVPPPKEPERTKEVPEFDEGESDEALIDVANAIKELAQAEEDNGGEATETQFFDVFDKVCHSEEQLSRCGGHKAGSDKIKDCMDGCCLRACSKYWYAQKIPSCVQVCVAKQPAHLK
jgi:hypothetical protein